MLNNDGLFPSIYVEDGIFRPPHVWTCVTLGFCRVYNLFTPIGKKAIGKEGSTWKVG
jgi:hypothetical protein